MPIRYIDLPQKLRAYYIGHDQHIETIEGNGEGEALTRISIKFRHMTMTDVWELRTPARKGGAKEWKLLA